jgi:hypothetical protein
MPRGVPIATLAPVGSAERSSATSPEKSTAVTLCAPIRWIPSSPLGPSMARIDITMIVARPSGAVEIASPALIGWLATGVRQASPEPGATHTLPEVRSIQPTTAGGGDWAKEGAGVSAASASSTAAPNTGHEPA